MKQDETDPYSVLTALVSEPPALFTWHSLRGTFPACSWPWAMDSTTCLKSHSPWPWVLRPLSGLLASGFTFSHYTFVSLPWKQFPTQLPGNTPLPNVIQQTTLPPLCYWLTQPFTKFTNCRVCVCVRGWRRRGHMAFTLHTESWKEHCSNFYLSD